MIIAKMDISGRMGIHPFTVKAGKEVSSEILKAIGGKDEAVKRGLVKEKTEKKADKK